LPCIKIVQRVPVRIALDPHELAEHPLQIGLSMQVDVETRRTDGERLPLFSQATPAYTTDVYDSVDAASAQRVKSIIAANDHDGAKTAPRSVTSLDTNAAPRHLAAGRTL
jgi:membrane fusion protein (multidrug efflux system)